MRPRVRRALRRLFWVLVKDGARAVCALCGWGLQRCVSVELAAERGADRATGSVSGMAWPAVPDPPPMPAPPPKAIRADAPAPAYRASTRETAWATWSGDHGAGLFIIQTDMVAAAIRNAGRC